MLMEIFNPWWKIGAVPASLVGKRRQVFYETEEKLPLRQIIAIQGLRRVGKTTLMYQVIDSLIKKGTNPINILYFSFDDRTKSPIEVLKEYETEIFKKNLRSERIFVFFDEIQKVPDWENAVKIIYDSYPNIKLFISGSMQIVVFKKTRESLAGRFFDIYVEPLDFIEYLNFKNISIDMERIELYEKEIKMHFKEFLKTGGFIEAINMSDIEKIQYFKESILRRVAFIDIPGVFRIDYPEILYTLLEIFSAYPGMYVDYRNLAGDLKIDQRTVSEYVDYLEKSLLAQKLYNFSTNRLTSEKKLKRIYLSNTGFVYALNPEVEFPVVLEQYIVNTTGARFFWRSPQKDEVDVVLLRDKDIIPVEVKIREQIKRKDTSALFKFMKKFSVEKGMMITLKTEKDIKKNGYRVNLIPYWKAVTEGTLVL